MTNQKNMDYPNFNCGTSPLDLYCHKSVDAVVDQTQLCSESDLGHHQIGISISDIPNRNFRFGNTHVRNVINIQIQLGISQIRSGTWSDLVHSIPQTQPYSKLT